MFCMLLTSGKGLENCLSFENEQYECINEGYGNVEMYAIYKY